MIKNNFKTTFYQKSNFSIIPFIIIMLLKRLNVILIFIFGIAWPVLTNIVGNPLTIKKFLIGNAFTKYLCDLCIKNLLGLSDYNRDTDRI